MRSQLLVLHDGQPGEAAERHVHVRVGAPGHRLHAGHVRPGGPAARHPGRRVVHVRLLLQAHGPHGRQLPQRRRHGPALCQHEVTHPDPRLGDVRADAPERRLHALLLLLPMVSPRLQARAAVRRRVQHVGDDLGSAAPRLLALCALHRPGPGPDLPRNNPLQFHGLHGHHQVLQRNGRAPRRESSTVAGERLSPAAANSDREQVN